MPTPARRDPVPVDRYPSSNAPAAAGAFWLWGHFLREDRGEELADVVIYFIRHTS